MLWAIQLLQEQLDHLLPRDMYMGHANNVWLSECLLQKFSKRGVANSKRAWSSDWWICVFIYISPWRKMKIPQPLCFFLFAAPVGQWPDKTRSPQMTGENLTETSHCWKAALLWKPHRPSSHRGLHCLNPGCAPSWTVGAERQLPWGVWRLFGSRSGGQPIRISPFPHVPDTWQFI